MMRKILLISLLLLFTVGLFACDQNETGDKLVFGYENSKSA